MTTFHATIPYGTPHDLTRQSWQRGEFRVRRHPRTGGPFLPVVAGTPTGEPVGRTLTVTDIPHGLRVVVDLNPRMRGNYGWDRGGYFVDPHVNRGMLTALVVTPLESWPQAELHVGDPSPPRPRGGGFPPLPPRPAVNSSPIATIAWAR